MKNKLAFSSTYKRQFAIILLAGLTVASVGNALAEQPITVLSKVERGAWTLKERGSSDAGRRLCVTDPAVLLKPEHQGAICTQFIIENKPDSATIHYSCAGSGHGHTSILRETNRLLSIQTQGILNGRPFDRTIEARRTGACSR